MNRRHYLKIGTVTLALGALSYKIIENKHSVIEFSLKEKEILLAHIVDVIIPNTDSPGAKEAGVHHYIVNVMQNCMTIKDQKSFDDGLIKLEQYSKDIFAKRFVNCSIAEKNNIIEHFYNKSLSINTFVYKVKRKIFGEPFFSQLKSLTVQGFCMSELGATKALSYDYIPVYYKSCIKLNKEQKSWATK